MQAIVLAGGLGTRLRSVVADCPKPMAPVAGRPFLAWILDALDAAGFDRVVLATGYRHEAIEAHFGARHGRLALAYSVEATPLGTGGAIREAARHTDADPVWVLNGDTFLALDFAAMAAVHAQAGAELSLAAAQVPDVGRYGALKLEGDRVGGFLEKGPTGPGHINGGTYLLSRRLLQRLPAEGAFSFEKLVLEPLVAAQRPPAFTTSGLFIDIGIPEDYARAQTLFGPAAG